MNKTITLTQRKQAKELMAQVPALFATYVTTLEKMIAERLKRDKVDNHGDTNLPDAPTSP